MESDTTAEAEGVFGTEFAEVSLGPSDVRKRKSTVRRVDSTTGILEPRKGTHVDPGTIPDSMLNSGITFDQSCKDCRDVVYDDPVLTSRMDYCRVMVVILLLVIAVAFLLLCGRPLVRAASSVFTLRRHMQALNSMFATSKIPLTSMSRSTNAKKHISVLISMKDDLDKSVNSFSQEFIIPMTEFLQIAQSSDK